MRTAQLQEPESAGEQTDGRSCGSKQPCRERGFERAACQGEHVWVQTVLLGFQTVFGNWHCQKLRKIDSKVMIELSAGAASPERVR